MEPAMVYLALVICVLTTWLVCERIWTVSAARTTHRSSGLNTRIAPWIIAALVGATCMRVTGAAAQTVPIRDRIIVDATNPMSDIPPPLRTMVGPAAPIPGKYTVAAGDCLWRIARAVLVERGVQPRGSAISDLWRAIYVVNRDLIGDNPDLIHPGQVLELPAR